MKKAREEETEKRDQEDCNSSPFSMFAYRLATNPTALTGLTIILMMLGSILLADVIAPYSPGQRAGPSEHPPGMQYLLGTNGIGQDLLSRVIYGARMSLGFGFLSIGLAVGIGVPLGLVSGYAGGPSDFLIMRVIDFMMSFPGILLAILIMAMFGQSQLTLIVAVGLINVPQMTRQTRAAVLRVKEEEYVLASRALGAGHARIMFRRILPNILGPVIVLSTLGLGTAILETAGLGYLGLGMSADAVEWGTMLAQSQKYFLASPWIPLAPGIAISLSVLGFNLLGDVLRDYMAPEVGDT